MRIEIESFFGDIILYSEHTIKIEDVRHHFYEIVSSSENVDLRDKVLSMLENEFNFKMEKQEAVNEDIVATIDTDINQFIQHK